MPGSRSAPGVGQLAARLGRLPGLGARRQPRDVLTHCTSWQEARHALGALTASHRLESAIQAVQRWPHEVLADLDGLGVAALPNRGEVVRALVEALEPGLPLRAAGDVVRSLRLRPSVAVSSMAKLLVERHQHPPLQTLLALGVRPQDGLQELPLDFDLQGRPALVVFAQALLDGHAPSGDSMGMIRRLSSTVAESGLGQEDRFALARLIAQREDGQGLLLVLHRLGLDETVTKHLARDAARQAMLVEAVTIGLFTAPEHIQLGVALGQQILDMETLRDTGCRMPQPAMDLSVASHCELFAQGLRLASEMAMRFTSADHMMEFARAVWAPLHPGVRRDAPHEAQEALPDAFESFSPHPLLRAAFERALALPDDQQRGQRMAWLLDAALSLGSVADAHMPRLQADIAFLSTRRAPALRRQLTDALTFNVHVHGDAIRYADFADCFERPHMRGFATALFPLYAQDGGLPPAALLGTLSHDLFKNSRQQYPALRDMLGLATNWALPPAQRRNLLERAVPVLDSGRTRAEGFRDNLRMLAVLMSSLQIAPDEHCRAALVALAMYPSGHDLRHALLPHLMQRLPGSATGARPSPHWGAALESRQIEPLLVYRQNLLSDVQSGSLEHDEGMAALHALDRYADVTIWSAEPAAAFAAMRYDPTASAHLAHLQAVAPQAYENWQRALEPVPATTRGGGRYVDTAEAADLFMCGTDVGSCQAVSAPSEYSRALLGFVLDGKYRMLALQRDDGVTQARRMMRLLIDENTGRPVLFLEKLHANAGIDKEGAEDLALIELARTKARELNCPLVCDSDDTAAGPDYGGGVVSLGCSAPMEYVDACGIGRTSGTYRLVGCEVQMPED